MLRVCKTYLTENNRRLSFKDKPFYGLAYVFNQEGLIERIERIINGEVVGSCNERINPEDKETPRVHVACLMHAKAFWGRQQEPKYYQEEDHDEDSQYVFRGELFEGYAYIFDGDGILITEAAFVDGSEYEPYIKYYSSGIIKESELNDETKEWHEDGRPQGQYYCSFDAERGVGTGFHFGVGFKEDGN